MGALALYVFGSVVSAAESDEIPQPVRTAFTQRDFVMNLDLTIDHIFPRAAFQPSSIMSKLSMPRESTIQPGGPLFVM